LLRSHAADDVMLEAEWFQGKHMSGRIPQICRMCYSTSCTYSVWFVFPKSDVS